MFHEPSVLLEKDQFATVFGEGRGTGEKVRTDIDWNDARKELIARFGDDWNRYELSSSIYAEIAFSSDPIVDVGTTGSSSAAAWAINFYITSERGPAQILRTMELQEATRQISDNAMFVLAYGSITLTREQRNQLSEWLKLKAAFLPSVQQMLNSKGW